MEKKAKGKETVSEESRKKMSESMKGKNKGKVVSEEQKQYLKDLASKRKRNKGKFI
jgi:hypothetical protein